MTTPTPADPAGHDPAPEHSEDQLLLLIDPGWTPPVEGASPPPEAVAGGWLVHPDGRRGRFRANPDHTPSPGAPSDPLDAVLHLLARGEATTAELLAALGEIDLAIAVDDGGVALVAPAPDGVAAVRVATCPARRRGVDAAGWREVTIVELAAALPQDGVDVLLNPGAPASMRVAAATIRDAAGAAGGAAASGAAPRVASAQADRTSYSPEAIAAASSIRDR